MQDIPKTPTNVKRYVEKNLDEPMVEEKEKSVEKKSVPLPLFRRDIACFRGPDDDHGAPTYNLYDPVSENFFQITWLEAKVIQHLEAGMTMDNLVAVINKETTLKVTPKDVQHFFIEASAHNLLEVAKSAERMEEEAKQQKVTFFSKIVRQYLSFSFVLADPDKFIEKTLPFAKMLVSLPLLILYAILTVLGIIGIFIHLDTFLGSFLDFYNTLGFVYFLLALSFIKLLHELAHAYVAKDLGLHVHVLGITVICMWPSVYIDTTEGWKLSNRRHRIMISAAGTAIEVVIAGLCSFGWVVTSSSVLKSLFFVLSSTSLVRSFIINLNPAYRLDGYYILADSLRIDNFQTRSFNYFRWLVRKWFLSINLPDPEDELSNKKKFVMVIYTLFTITFRMALYTAIAFFAFSSLPKALGILAIALAVVSFLLLPLWDELKQIKNLLPFFYMTRRFAISMCLFTLLFFWLVLPWPHTMKFTGISEPTKDFQQLLYTPADSRIDEINIKNNYVVKAGDVLVKLSSTPLELEINQRQADQVIIEKQIQTLLSDKNQGYLPSKKSELASISKFIESLKFQKELLDIVAKIPGTVVQWDDTLKPGEYLQKNAILGRIVDLHHLDIIFFVPEGDISSLSIGQKFKFRLHNDPSTIITGTISHIESSRTEALDFAQFGNLLGGPLPVTQASSGAYLLTESYYIAYGTPDPEQKINRIGLAGTVSTEGPWRSLLLHYIRRLFSGILSESST